METSTVWNRKLWLSALAVLVAAGCNPGADTDRTAANAPDAPSGAEGRIILISNSTSPFWVAVEKGMTDAAQELGVNAELMRSDGTVAGQIQRLEQVTTMADVKGVAVSFLEAGAEGLADRLRDLQEKGVYVLTFDSDGPIDTRTAYIGANNRVAGEQAGRAAAQLRPEGGKVVAFVGTQAAANAKERLEGFKAGAGPNIEVVEVMEDGTNQTKARQNVTSAIQTHTEADILLGLWSYNAAAIAEEVVRAGKQDEYTLVTFDAEPNTVTQLQNGVIDATVIQQPYEYGYQSVKLLNALMTGDQATVDEMVADDTTVDVPTRIVVSSGDSPVKGDNVILFSELQQYLNEKGLQGT